VEISHRTIIFTALLFAAAWALFQIIDVIFIFFVAMIFMGAMNPTITKLEKKGFHRWLAILVLYLTLISLLAIALAGIFPPLIQQTKELIKLLPQFSQSFGFLGVSDEVMINQINGLGSLPAQLLKLSISVFSNIVTILVVLVITFYLLLEHKNLDDYLFYLFGKEGKLRGKRFIDRLEKRLGSWVRAQMILMTFVGLISYVGFRVLGLEFALALALLAAVLEIIPNIGPTIAAIPAVIFGFLISPLMGLATLAWSFVVQQVENNFLVPKVMKNAIGVNPVVTLFSLAIGFKLAGAAGALLAIPTYLTIEVVIREFFLPSKHRSRQEK